MTHWLLFALFFVLFASESLDINTSLAPGLSVKNAFIYFIFFVLAVQTALTRQRKLELLSVFVPFSIYVIYAIFSWVVVLLLIKYPGYTFMPTLIALKGGPVEHLMVLLIFFYGTTNKDHAAFVFRGIVWLIIVTNVFTIAEVLNILDLDLVRVREDGRIGGTIGNANEFAAFLVVFLPAIVAIYLTAKGKMKYLAAVGAFLSCLAFLMAVSRGAIVGLLIGSCFSAFFLRSIIPATVMIRAATGAILLTTVVVVTGIAAGYGEILLDRISAFGGNKFEASSGRSMIWGRALSTMLEHPVSFITGFGWNSYDTDVHFRLATHNTYLDILYNLGIIGVSLFLVVAANVLRAARIGLQSAGPDSKTLLTAFVFGFSALLVTLIFGQLPSTWLYIWAFVGVALRLAVSEASTAHVNIRSASSTSSHKNTKRSHPAAGGVSLGEFAKRDVGKLRVGPLRR